MRVAVRVEGTVQGVGFRPYVYRLAQEESLAGHVFNDERGVGLEVEGADDAVARFLARLPAEAPPLARLDRVSSRALPVVGSEGFRILASRRGGASDVVIAPDTATCADCLGELGDPADRRHCYPFINCTNCGPRFTIVTGAPYDRPLTTMAGFAMCADCRREYEDPGDRRFHAQPNACPVCGPRARLVDAGGGDLGPGGDAIAAAIAALAGGLIVAVKGLGGYHLACNAADAAAVDTLRARKRREDKPFALMVPDLAAAEALVVLGEQERALLASPERPIVLARRRPGAAVAAGVAPLSPDLGVMLPATPLQHLLATRVLVMTSGNVSDEPIAYADDDALSRLAGIADRFLIGDRPIQARVDDSIARVVRGRPQLLRRARGYVPAPLALPAPAPALLAVGAELKATFCVARGTRAWVSHHLGDLEHYAAYEAFVAGVGQFEALFDVRPELVVHDLHPGYRSTAYALEREDAQLVGVQHHHAHLAACLAEHGCEHAVGAIFDGTGYGPDGTVWGGEILVGGLRDSTRIAHLHPVRMPGGAAAIREPWRMACAWLLETFGTAELPARLAAHVGEREWAAVASIASSPAVSPVTTSMGRLFDAVAALCGIAPRVSYEGQAAIELAAAAGDAEHGSYGFAGLDPRPVIRAIAGDLADGVPVGVVAARFHDAVAGATIEACAGHDTVVLSGGVFQNRRLAETVANGLTARVLMPERLPCNDGGISFGQAATAAARAT